MLLDLRFQLLLDFRGWVHSGKGLQPLSLEPVVLQHCRFFFISAFRSAKRFAKVF